MVTLRDLEVEASIMFIFAVFLIFCIMIIYGIEKEKEFNPIVAGVLTVGAILGIVIIFKFLYLDKKERLLNQFKSGYEVICETNHKKILVSKERGYTLKGGYFVKDDVVLEYEMCSDM